MLGDALHNYDLELCDYAGGNVRLHLGDPEFAELLAKGLPSALVAYFHQSLDPTAEENLLLLTDDELYDLEVTIQCSDPAPGRLWEPYESLHRRHIHTLQEVRESLSKPAAEEWSRACAEFGEQLMARRLSLPAGLEIVRGWVWRLRELLRAMNAVDLLPCPGRRKAAPMQATRPASVETSGRDSSQLTVRQVAERLGVAVGTIYALCARQELAHIRIGAGRGTLRIDERALEEYLKGGTVRPETPTAPPSTKAERKPPEIRLKNLALS
jgi:excisionase family DNA binding protein